MHHGDLEWAASVFLANHRSNLTPEEREEGFVQGTLTAERLQIWLQGPGSVLAEVDGERAGVVMVTTPDVFTHGPAEKLAQVATEAGVTDFLMYGPIVIDKPFRGRGLMRELWNAVVREDQGRHERAVLFLETANERSRATHEHLGWELVTPYEYDGREFFCMSHEMRPEAASRRQ